MPMLATDWFIRI